MPPEITLTYTDESGSTACAVVQPPRFTIGRAPDNHLVINNSNLSRRHAVIEFINGAPFISDCGSQNGTTVNHQFITSAVALHERDLITLGGACDLTVGISSGVGASLAAEARAGDFTASRVLPLEHDREPAVKAPASGAVSSWLNPVALAGASIGLILLVAVTLIVLSLRPEGTGPSVEHGVPGNSGAISGEDTNAPPHAQSGEKPAPVAITNEQGAAVTPSPPADEVSSIENPEQIGRAVQGVMRRISADGRGSYISEAGMKDVNEQVNEYRGSSALAQGLDQMSRGCAEVKALAQAHNLQPLLLIYAALAQADSGRDPVSVARQMTPKLLTLRATFGTQTANSSLLLIAAYPYPFNPPLGTQARTAHPLASKLIEFGGRKSVVETSVARSVWFLREKNALMPEAYQLVVRLLAIGVIAQAPSQYGVEAKPLFC